MRSPPAPSSSKPEYQESEFSGSKCGARCLTLTAWALHVVVVREELGAVAGER